MFTGKFAVAIEVFCAVFQNHQPLRRWLVLGGINGSDANSVIIARIGRWYRRYESVCGVTQQFLWLFAV